MSKHRNGKRFWVAAVAALSLCMSACPLEQERILAKRKEGVTDRMVEAVFTPREVRSFEPLPGASDAAAPEDGGWEVLELEPGVDPAELVARLLASGHYEVAEREEAVVMEAIPNDLFFPMQWNLNNVNGSNPTDAKDSDIEAPEAWNLRTDASSVVVAVIDSGADLAHRDLAPNLWRNTREVAGNGVDDDGNGYVDDVNGYDFVRRDGRPDDEHGHGTHVAGIVAAAANDGFGVAGVAWRSKLMVLKAMSVDWSTGLPTLMGSQVTAFEATRYAIANGAKVILMSWSTASRDGLQAAIDEAREKGVLVVAAAGNGGIDLDVTPRFPASFTHANVVTVGMIQRDGSVNSNSNFGSPIDVWAPGWEITSTAPGNGHTVMSGTSMAAAHAAGVAALVRAHYPNLGPAGVRDALARAADSIPWWYTPDGSSSAGRLNAVRALRYPPTVPVAVDDSF